MPNSRESRPQGQPSVRVALERAGHLLSRSCLALSAVALFVIVAINAANVASRHFLGIAWSGAEEAMLFSMIFAVFAGATAAAWHGSHMRFDMFVGRLPPGWRRAAVAFVALLSVGILAVLSSASYQVVSLLYGFGQTSVALAFPMWVAQGCVLAGFVLIATMVLLRLAVFGATVSHAEFEAAAERQP